MPSRFRPVVFVLALVFAACGPAKKPVEDAAVFGAAVDQEIVIATAPNAMRYEQTRVEARAGTRIRIVLDNSGTSSPAMQHNVVVVRDRPAVQRVGLAAQGEDDHLPDDTAILAATPLAGPGARTAVLLTVPPPGEYPYLCTYPGHFTMMQGVLVSTP